MTRIWLDDLREPPDERWTWVKTTQEAIDLLTAESVTHASLDNDLGLDVPEGRTLVLWMAEHDAWPSEEIAIHSANPVAFEYMAGVIERYGPFDRTGPGRTQFRRWEGEPG